MQDLLKEIRACDVCREHLPLGPRPIIEAVKNSKIILISQAPGRVVHQSGVAWKDQSGKKLREWLDVGEETFYNPANFAILPMGFCPKGMPPWDFPKDFAQKDYVPIGFCPKIYSPIGFCPKGDFL